MLGRVAAWSFAAFLIVSPAALGIETNTFADAPAAAAMPIATAHDPGQDQIGAKDKIKVQAQKQDQTQDDAQSKMAALDPAEPTIPSPAMAEPFGLAAVGVASGDVLTKWSGVEADIRAENEILAHCRDSAEQCPAAAQNFLAIIAQGRARTGRARIGVINRAVNMAIQPARDPAHWRAPLDTLSLGRGDCKDYAIAKYVALMAAGVAAQDVKLIIVRNLAAGEDHAVVGVRDEGNWIVLDNRWLTLVEDIDMPKVIPLFVLDEQGVRVFTPALSATHRASAPVSL